MPSRVFEPLKAGNRYSIQVHNANVSCWGELSDAVVHDTISDTGVPAAPSSAALLTQTPNFFLIRCPASTDIDAKEHRFYISTSSGDSTGSHLIRQLAHPTNVATIQEGEASIDTVITIALGTTYHFWVTSADISANESSKVYIGGGALANVGGAGINHAFGISLDAPGSTISTGSKGYTILVNAGTINRWYLIGDTSGSQIQIDLKKSGTSIIGAGNKPILSTGQRENAAPSSWTSVSISTGDEIEFIVESAATISRANLVIEFS